MSLLSEIYGQPELGGDQDNIVGALVKELHDGAASFLMQAKRKWTVRDLMNWVVETQQNFSEEEIIEDFPHFHNYEHYADEIVAALNNHQPVHEKAVSKAQQRYFGMVHAGKIRKPKGMKDSDVEKFARTKHKGLPGHVDEGKSTMRFIEYLITEREQELREAKAKPDYLDRDGDGNKKESFKKAERDKKKKMKEGYDDWKARQADPAEYGEQPEVDNSEELASMEGRVFEQGGSWWIRLGPNYDDHDGPYRSEAEAWRAVRKMLGEADIDHHNAAPHLDRKKRQDSYKTKTKSAARHGDDHVVRGVSNRSSVGNYLRKAMRMNESKRKPDFKDVDGDGNKKESWKKAQRDRKK